MSDISGANVIYLMGGIGRDFCPSSAKLFVSTGVMDVMITNKCSQIISQTLF